MEVSEMNREQTLKVLEEHFNSCVRFWLHDKQSGTNGDERQAYINAMEDIKNIQYNPFCIQAKAENLLDQEAVKEFKKYRLMDIYGTRWEEHKDMMQEVSEMYANEVDEYLAELYKTDGKWHIIKHDHNAIMRTDAYDLRDDFWTKCPVFDTGAEANCYIEENIKWLG